MLTLSVCFSLARRNRMSIPMHLAYQRCGPYSPLSDLRPSEIRYSQDSISHKFRDGNFLTSTFAQLISGKLKVTSLPNIEYIGKDGNFYVTSGNRRLFLYKHLEKAGFLSTIIASKSSSSEIPNFTTECNGQHVVCRAPNVEDQIKKIVEQWKKGEDVTIWEAAPEPPSTRNFASNGWSDSDSDD